LLFGCISGTEPIEFGIRRPYAEIVPSPHIPSASDSPADLPAIEVTAPSPLAATYGEPDQPKNEKDGSDDPECVEGKPKTEENEYQ